MGSPQQTLMLSALLGQLTACYVGLETTEQAGTDNSSSVGSGDTEQEIAEVVVDLDTEQFEVGAVCVNRAETPRVLSVSPEGDLWLHDPERPRVRVIEPSGAEHVITMPWPVTFARAWGRDTASIVAAEGLWAWDTDRAQAIAWPASSPRPESFCGDPAFDGDGLVIASDLFSRDLGQWWRWNVPGGLAAGSTIATSAGACWGTKDRAWLLQGSSVWSIQSDWVGAQPGLEPSLGLAADEAFGVASIVGPGLVLGDDDFQRVEFEAGAVATLSAGTDVLWVSAQGHLYRLADGVFTEAVAQGAAIAASELHADGVGGVWTLDDNQACYRSTRPNVRITGLRHNERRRTSELTATFEAAGMDSPEVTIDGESVSLNSETAERWRLKASVEDEGWHELVLTAQTDAGHVQRSVRFEIEALVPATWQQDVLPLFEAHCSGAACHGPDPASDDQLDLGRYETWVEAAEIIRGRVGQTSDMPPPGTGDGTWGVDEILLVLGWLDAGLPTQE